MAKGLNMKVLLGLQTKAFNKGVSEARKQLNSLKNSFTSFAGAMGAGIGFAKFVSSVKETTMELSSAQSVLKNVSKSTMEFGQTQEWVRKLAKTYKQDIIGLTTNFAKFKASADQCNVSLEDQKKIYEALVRAASFYHLSADETNSAILAVQQMMSKGKVTAEELRKQLGNVLPSAFGLMAKAANASTAELEKMMSSGKLLSGQILPKFADELNKVTQHLDMDTLEGAVNSLKNAWTEFVESMEVSGIIKGTYNSLAGMLNWAKKNIKDIILVIKSLAEVYFGAKLLKAIKNVKTALMGLSAGGWAKALAAAVAIVVNKLVSARKEIKNLNDELGKAQRESDLTTRSQKINNVKEEALDRQARLGTRQEYETAKYRLSHEGSYKGQSILQKGFDQHLIKEWDKLQSVINKCNEQLRPIEEQLRQLANGEFDKINEAWTNYVEGVKKLDAQKSNGAKIPQSSYNALEKQLIAEVGSVVSLPHGLDGMIDWQGQTPTFFKNIKELYSKWGNQPIVASTVEITSNGGGGSTTEAPADAQKEAFKSIYEDLVKGKQKIDFLESNGVDTGNQLLELYKNGAEAMKELGKVPEYLDNLISKGGADVGWASELKEMFTQGNNMGTTLKILDMVEQYNNDSKEAAERVKLNIVDAAEQTSIAKKYVDDILQELINAGINLDISEIKPFDTEYIFSDEGNSSVSTSNPKFYAQLGDKVGTAIDELNLPEDIAKNLKEAITEGLAESIKQKGYAVVGAMLDSGSIGGRNKAFDYKKSEAEKLTLDADFGKEQLDKMEASLKNLEAATNDIHVAGTEAYEAYNKLTDDIQNAYKAINELEEKATLSEILADVKDLRKEMNSLTMDSIGGVIDGISSIHNSFKSLQTLWEEEDASPFEVMIQSLQTLWSVFETINGVIETFNSLKQTSTMLSNAQAAAAAAEGTAEAGAALMSAGAKEIETKAVEKNTVAKAGEAVAGAASSVAATPWVGAALAVAAAIAIAATMKSSMGKFANGGIIGGNSTHGDRLTANVNSGEMILNKGQQSTLFNAINSGNLGGGNVEFKIRGADLIGTINNYNSRRRG